VYKTVPRVGIATSNEVAEYRRMSKAQLAQERYLGRGPAYLKDPGGRRVTYRWEDVHAFIEGSVVTPGRAS
jgi:hypothetical protein